MLKQFVLAACLLTSSQLPAESTRKLIIQSKYDRYELIISSDAGTVGGKPADLKVIKEFLPALTGPLNNECPPPKTKPEVTIKDGVNTRFVYLKEGMIGDGTNCINVNGDGLLYFPIHRDFLAGTKTDSLAIKAEMSASRDNEKLFDLKKQNGSWQNADKTSLLNWEFIDHLRSSLENFSVRVRALPELAQGKPHINILLDNKKYDFYKISTNAWALQKPGAKWLEISDDWTFWYDLDKSVLEDRFGEQIRVVEDSTRDAKERAALLEKLEGLWSPNLRDMYHSLVLNKDEDHALQALALNRLRSKPSLETAQVMGRFIGQTQDDQFKKTASQILKINEPQGPLYNPSASAAQRAKAIEYWSQWWSRKFSTP